MIGALLRRLFGTSVPRAVVPAGMRVYAIGDIHGRADLLDQMADLIDADGRNSTTGDPLIIFLGDYIDRGPSSAAVIDRLVRGDLPAPIIALRGNHDDLFLQFMRGDLSLGDYRRVGGDATLESYGIDPAKLKRLHPSERHERVRQAVPPAHLAFLEATGFSQTVGDYFFCHAGARPGVPLEAQSPDDLMWIREEFLHSAYDFGKTVVHGHTPVSTPEISRNGINVDTKAFASDRLSAVVLQDAERRFIAT